MIEDNIKLGQPHPSITSGDTKEARKLEERTIAEIKEVDRRHYESMVYNDLYSKRFEPSVGAACFSYSYFYRKLEQSKVNKINFV